MKPSIKLKSLGLSLAFMLFVAACGDGSGNSEAANNEDLVLEGEVVASAELWGAAQGEGSLTLYTAHFEEAEIALAEVFTEDTGVDVEVIRLPGSRLHERILSEYGADLLEADVIHQSDIALNLEYAEDEIVEEYQIPEALDENIPDEWKDADGAYYGTFISAMGIIYNSELVSPEDAPSTWEDLLDPKWQGQMATPFAGIGGSGWAMALFQSQEIGDNYWEDFAAQDPSILESASSIAQEVARGEYPVAVNSIATSTETASNGAPLEVVYPEDGTPTYPYGLSKVAESPNSDAGALYMNWRNSQRGLTAGAEKAAVYTPHPNVPPPPGVGGEPQPELDEINAWVADQEDWLNLRSEYVSEWNQTFGFSGD